MGWSVHWASVVPLQPTRYCSAPQTGLPQVVQVPVPLGPVQLRYWPAPVHTTASSFQPWTTLAVTVLLDQVGAFAMTPLVQSASAGVLKKALEASLTLATSPARGSCGVWREGVCV